MVPRIVPKLVAILVGNDPASQVYVRNKACAFEQLNCRSQTCKLEEEAENKILAIERKKNSISDFTIEQNIEICKKYTFEIGTGDFLQCILRLIENEIVIKQDKFDFITNRKYFKI